MFTKKFTLITYFDNAEGLRSGQPVDLEGVPVGNVTGVRVVPNCPLDPVQVVMKIKADCQPFIPQRQQELQLRPPAFWANHLSTLTEESHQSHRDRR